MQILGSDGFSVKILSPAIDTLPAISKPSPVHMADPLAPADPKKSVAVFASAGTGKTWLLVARILRLLLAGAPPDSILAITFTRKAAAEIQQRLTERLADWLALDDPDLIEDIGKIGVDKPEQYLDSARALFETVQFADQGIRIATFHSFFQELLQRFPLEAGVPAGFTIPQREQAARLHQAAEDQLFEEALRHPDGELAESLNVVMAEVPNLRELRRILEGVRTHTLEWRAFEGDFTLEQLRAHLRDEVFRLSEVSDRTRLPDAEPELQRLADLLDDSANSEGAHQARAAAKLRHGLDRREDGDLEQARRLNDALNNTETQETRSSLLPTSKAVQKRLGESKVEEINRLLSQWSPEVRKTMDGLLRQKACELNGHWYAVVGQLTENYQRLKQTYGYLDYDDLLWFANHLMSDGIEWVQYKLGQRFRHVLVDEFQDTDALSWQTLQIFLEALHETGDEPGSAFIVGDTKQSIYQWRRANPEIQKEAGTYLQSHLQAAAPTSMDASRRSSKVIIDFVNAAFGEGGLFPLPDFPAHQTHLAGLWGRVELLPSISKETRAKPPEPDPNEPLRNPLTEPRPETHSTHIERMAGQIAERLRHLVDQRVAIDDREGGVRAARYRDCMILVNRRTHVPEIEHALARLEIPFARQSRQTLLNHLEVRDMQALLQCLLRPADDLHLVQVLRSPLYHVTDEELMDLARTGEASDRWVDRLEALAGQKEPGHPLRRAAKNFTAWRGQVGRIPTHDLLDRIYFETDALRCYRRAWPGERGERAVSNLIRFIELTLEFDSGRYPSTAAFVHFIEEMRCGRVEGYDAPDLVSLKSDDQDDRVQILTVHAAKGLEKPIVVYAELDKPKEQGKHGDILIDWPTGEARPRRFLFRPRTEDRDTCSQKCLDLIRQKRKAEDLNRAYVAFTRARQVLILCQYKDYYEALLKLFPDPPDPTSGLLARGPGPTSLTADAPPSLQTPEPDCTGLGELFTLPGTASPSRIGDPEPDEAESADGLLQRQRALERGQALHALIERLETGEPDRAELERLAHDAHRTPEDPDFRSWLDEARRVVADPELDPVFRPGPQTHVHTEVPVLCRTESGEGFGIIDRLLLSPGVAWVIDFKSHATEDPEQLAGIAERYTAQMNEYARFIRIVYPGRAVRCSLLFTRSRRLHDMPGPP